MYKGESVLVTGGAGFIGSHLCDSLRNLGANVSVVDDLSSGKKENIEGIELFQGDIRSSEFISEILLKKKPKFIFHLAANASVPVSVQNPVYDFSVNASGTISLLESVKKHLIKTKIILASSGAVYGEPKVLPVKESSQIQPISPYGTSKVCAEEISSLFSRMFEVPVVVGRIFNSYGPRMPRFVIFDFLNKLKNDPTKLEILGNGKQERDFTYVSDTVSGLLTVGSHGTPGETYNIATGRSYTVKNLAETMLNILGLNASINFTGESWLGDAQVWQVDITKLKNLGYVPKTTLDVGLKETINWFNSI